MKDIERIRVNYTADPRRYEGVTPTRRMGSSGLVMPEMSLGFWWNFGAYNTYGDSLDKMMYAFDHGIFCFDLANNYGPPFGAAEETFGRMMKQCFMPHRREMIITSKAGYDMWPGPNGTGSSRKMLMGSLDESLQRMGLDYVDIFYSHRYDGVTPIEETMQALVDIVRAGKALYVGLSNYPVEKLAQCVEYLEARDVHPVIYQGKYNMLCREPEDGHLQYCKEHGMAFTAFSPIMKGLLTDKYLHGIPADSRAALGNAVSKDDVDAIHDKIVKLNDLAQQRGNTLAQMATAWLLRRDEVTSVIIGPRTVDQLKDSLTALHVAPFSQEELTLIDNILAE